MSAAFSSTNIIVNRHFSLMSTRRMWSVPLLRLQTNMCHVCSIVVSVLLIMDLYHLLNPLAAEKPNADRKIQHKALTQQRGGRRRRQPKQKSTRTQLSGRRSHQKRRTPATPEGSFEEHTLAHSQKEKTKQKQDTDTHTIRVR